MRPGVATALSGPPMPHPRPVRAPFLRSQNPPSKGFPARRGFMCRSSPSGVRSPPPIRPHPSKIPALRPTLGYATRVPCSLSNLCRPPQRPQQAFPQAHAKAWQHLSSPCKRLQPAWRTPGVPIAPEATKETIAWRPPRGRRAAASHAMPTPRPPDETRRAPGPPGSKRGRIARRGWDVPR